MSQGKVSQHAFDVLRNEPAAEGIWRLVISSSVAATIMPGQFMNLAVPGDGSHILRIPLSFKCANADDSTVELLYAVVGEGTKRLSLMREGDSSVLTGPCGRGWWLPKNEGRALLVAGGIGLPPILAAAGMLAGEGVPYDMVVGVRTASLLLHDDLDAMASAMGEDGQLVICTDDGSFGQHGFTTDATQDLLDKQSYGQLYTCGAALMMAGVAKIAAEHQLACQASLERMMGCGFGACSCCNVELASGGYALCCQDGPVFDATEVVW